jgi:asparagine synthetase B (glutamine-hydrolysing)
VEYGVISHITPPNLLQNKYSKNFMEINPRGPETFSFQMISPNIFLGFHRLAIPGLRSLGNQPFIRQISKTKSIYSVCNGEINYNQIIQSDPLQIPSWAVKKLILLFLPTISSKELYNYLYNSISI